MVFQAIGNALNFVLDPILSPLLRLPPLLAIIIISFIISIVVSLIYKAVTDQDLMKQLKAEMKEFQKEMKELREHPEEMMKVQKKAMETNMKYMTQSFKPTLFTFIPLLIIFGWLAANLAYEPITPGEEFITTIQMQDGLGMNATLQVPENFSIISDQIQKVNADAVAWRVKAGGTGEYYLDYQVNGNSYSHQIIIDDQNYADPEKVIEDELVEKIIIEHEPIKPLNLFGWKVGWLGTYIIFSLIFSIATRKVLKLA